MKMKLLRELNYKAILKKVTAGDAWRIHAG